MRKSAERGYAAVLGMLFTVAFIALMFTYYQASPATSGVSAEKQKPGALESTQALQDISAKRAAEINAEMQ